MNNDTKTPVRAYLGGVEAISRALLRASDAGDFTAVEGMLELLRQQAGALTPWTDARICTSCWHAIPTNNLARVGGNHRGICATCWERQHTGAPDYIPSEN